MGALDSAFRCLAAEVTSTLGKRVKLTHLYGSAYDPDTQTTSVATVDEYVHAAVSMYDALELGDDVEASDLKVVMPARGIDEPQVGDRVEIDGVVYDSVRVRSHWSGDKVAAYEVQVRR